MTELTIYDTSTDSKRPATQDDIDRMHSALFKMATRPVPIAYLFPYASLSFRLAVYPNPMRDDGVFVAEEKEIKPYDGAKGLNGEPLFPATPATPYVIRSQLPKDFASEIVRRWNRGDASP